ncbi:unnamed protein product [Caenorhabditis auriculariae]|uniref:Uncharacterized protein n=1 Tax=Caenorhabditis auriculariae TaxID=2777116 RepID=A0A8S1GVP3_9PELO|nr:unnamed protein product [Caenorhabditis auriculariae]
MLHFINLPTPVTIPHNERETSMLTFTIGIDGKLTCDQTKTVYDLKSIEKLQFSSGTTIEVVCSDCLLRINESWAVMFSIIWVELNSLSIPQKCFATTLMLNDEFHVNLCCMVELPDLVAHCRLISRPDSNHDNQFLLIFPKSLPPILFSVEPSKLKRIFNFSETFPELEDLVPSGTVIRSSFIQNELFRFNVLGLDTGFVTISIYDIKDKALLKRCNLRFACSITVAEFLPTSKEDSQRLLISSAMGPAAIWRCLVKSSTGRMETKKSLWESHCQLEFTLQGSQKYDSVNCASVIDKNRIFIGTYKGKVLVYEIPSLVLERPMEITLSNSLTVDGAVFAIKEASVNSLTALTSDGAFSITNGS